MMDGMREKDEGERKVMRKVREGLWAAPKNTKMSTLQGVHLKIDLPRASPYYIIKTYPPTTTESWEQTFLNRRLHYQNICLNESTQMAPIL